MVINATFIKPVDAGMLKRLVRDNYNIITLEDNVAIGGFGSLVLKVLTNLRYRRSFRALAFKDKYISHGSVDELFKQEKMDIDEIVKLVKKMYNNKHN